MIWGSCTGKGLWEGDRECPEKMQIMLSPVRFCNFRQSWPLGRSGTTVPRRFGFLNSDYYPVLLGLGCSRARFCQKLVRKERFIDVKSAKRRFLKNLWISGSGRVWPEESVFRQYGQGIVCFCPEGSAEQPELIIRDLQFPSFSHFWHFRTTLATAVIFQHSDCNAGPPNRARKWDQELWILLTEKCDYLDSM